MPFSRSYIVRGVLLAILFVSVQSRAADTLYIDAPFARISLLPYAELFIDSTGKIGIEDILALDPDFIPYSDRPREGHYPEAYWIRVIVHTTGPLTGARITVPGDSIYDEVTIRLDYLDLHVLDDQQQPLLHDRSGLFVPASEKSLSQHIMLPAVALTLPAAGRYQLYLRLQNAHEPQSMPDALEIRSTEVPLPVIADHYEWLSIGAWGMFIIIGLYVLVFYYYVRDKAFLYFGMFCLLYSLDMWTYAPHSGASVLFAEHPRLLVNIFYLHLFSVPCLLLFGNAFIDIQQHFPAWRRYYIGMLWVFIVILSWYFIRSFWLPQLRFQPAFFLAILLLIPICIRLAVSKLWSARLFAAGIFFFLAGNLIGVLAIANGYHWAPIAWTLGQIILLFLFALGLGRRLLESERAKAEVAKVKELDMLKTRFFTNISHEFRTPLSLILGPLQQAEENVPYSDTEGSENEVPVKAGHIQVMKRNALRLQQLVDQILDLSRLEAGKLSLQLQKGPIIAFIRSRVSEFVDIARNRHIHLITTYSADNEQACFDPDKLEKILVNILSNALKHTPAYQELRVEATAGEHHLKVRVSDTGPGMSKEEVGRIFERYYQAEQATQQGSGIGMALVKELVDLHRGQIHIDSQLEKGTTVSLTLSIHPDDYTPQELSAESISSSSTDLALADLQPNGSTQGRPSAEHDSRPLVLVVEDNTDLQVYLTEILTDNFHVLIAGDGQQGKEQALTHIPDLIVCDVMMPKMNGYELCNFLKNEEKTSHIPIVLLTAKSAESDKLTGLRQGAQDYLTKPFQASELLAKLQNFIQLREQWRRKYQYWQPSADHLNSLDEQFLQNITSHIQENLSNEYYSVEALAQQIGYSRSQLFRKLKALTDKSPLEVIKEHRLHYARQLLQKKAMTVSEAAYEVGYSNVSYFSRSFKEAFGVLPSEVR